MKILSFDTTSEVSSLSIYIDGVFADKITIAKKRENSSKLIPSIERILSDNGVDINDIDVIISSKGPGSFTGIRIGLSTLVGFKVSGIKAKLYAPSAFDVIYNRYKDKDGKILVKIPSGRGDYFVIVFDEGGKELIEPKNISPEALSDLERKLGLSVVSGFDSDDMIKWYLNNIDNPDVLKDSESIEPFYIRPPDVTIKKS